LCICKNCKSPKTNKIQKNPCIYSCAVVAYENSRPSSLPARVAFCVKNETPLGQGAKKDGCFPAQASAVDAFLEISTHLFLSFLSNLRTRNEFTACFPKTVCLHYISSKEDSSINSTVATAYGLNQSGLGNNMWPILVTQMPQNMYFF